MPSAKIRGRRRRCAGVATALGWEPAVPPTTKSAAANQAKLTRMSLPMRWGVLTVEVVIIESCHRIILSIFGGHVTSPGIGWRQLGWVPLPPFPRFSPFGGTTDGTPDAPCDSRSQSRERNCRRAGADDRSDYGYSNGGGSGPPERQRHRSRDQSCGRRDR